MFLLTETKWFVTKGINRDVEGSDDMTANGDNRYGWWWRSAIPERPART